VVSLARLHRGAYGSTPQLGPEHLDLYPWAITIQQYTREATGTTWALDAGHVVFQDVGAHSRGSAELAI